MRRSTHRHVCPTDAAPHRSTGVAAATAIRIELKPSIKLGGMIFIVNKT
jgi:hypothetical protein